jgi:hypothetical protein
MLQRCGSDHVALPFIFTLFVEDRRGVLDPYFPGTLLHVCSVRKLLVVACDVYGVADAGDVFDI